MSADRPEQSEPRPADAAPAPSETASFVLNPEGLPHDNAPTIISRAVTAASPTAAGQFANLVRGRKLAHFELEEPIGVGGMAAVIRARDLHLDRPVALKVLPPDMAADPEMVNRFEHESRAAAKLDHENIARVYYCGQEKGLHFIAFEFVEGENLRARIERQGRIPVAEAVHYVLQIAAGLAHAAARGVVHRDIKPSNIIIGEQGRAKLVDMGLARSIDKRAEGGLTHSGVTLGTFDYISPEQALEPREADVRSDIYSLGCTFYQMLTGHSPVPQGTAARKLRFHQSECPLDPREVNPEIPDEVAAILAKMMAKDPQQRYQQPELLVEHLQAAAGRMSGIAHPAGHHDVDSILPSPPQFKPLFVMAAGALVLTVLIALLGPYFGSPTDNDPPLSNQVSANDRRVSRSEAGADSKNPVTKTPGDVPRGLPVAAPQVVASVQELRELLADERDVLVQLEDGIYDLDEPGPDDLSPLGLQVSNCRVVIEAKPGANPIIRVRGRSGDRNVAALNAVNGKIVLVGLRFELEAGPDGGLPQALNLRGGHVICRDCEFLQQPGAAVRAGEAIPAVVRALRSAGPNPLSNRLEFRQCIFYGGQRALDLESTELLEIERCAFGRFDQPILLRSRDAVQGKTLLTLSESAFLLGAGPLLWAETRRVVHLDVTRCVCSHLAVDDGQPAPTLLLLGQQPFDRWRFRFQDNCFHRLGSLVTHMDEDGTLAVLAAKLADLAKLSADCREVGSVTLEENPWQETDPAVRLTAGTREAAVSAFRLKTNLAAVRRTGAVPILGPQRLLGQPLYASLEPHPADATASVPKPAVKELLVDGVGGQPGAYRSLAGALSDADFEEEVEIVVTLKWTGTLPIRPVEIGSRIVTIRAAPGCHPELTFNPDSDAGADGEAALFRVRDGSLTLEQLHFRLQPTLKEVAKLQSLVAITGTGRCRLKGCLATLLGADESRMALAAIADPTGAMMGTAGKAPRAGLPALEFEDCLVRGQGDLVTVRVSRPYRLDLKNVLVVLTGSLLGVEGNKREANMPAEGAAVSFDRVTAFVSQHLVCLRATATQPVHVPLRVSSATTCLFASADEHPLLRVEGPESEQELKRRLTWQGKKNFYSTAGSILVWQPLGAGEMPHKYDRERWGDLWGPDDDQARFGRGLRFAGYPSGAKTPAEVVPGDFRIAAADTLDPELHTRGADLEKLPVPPPASSP